MGISLNPHIPPRRRGGFFGVAAIRGENRNNGAGFSSLRFGVPRFGSRFGRNGFSRSCAVLRDCRRYRTASHRKRHGSPFFGIRRGNTVRWRKPSGHIARNAVLRTRRPSFAGRGSPSVQMEENHGDGQKIPHAGIPCGRGGNLEKRFVVGNRIAKMAR